MCRAPLSYLPIKRPHFHKWRGKPKMDLAIHEVWPLEGSKNPPIKRTKVRVARSFWLNPYSFDGFKRLDSFKYKYRFQANVLYFRKPVITRVWPRVKHREVWLPKWEVPQPMWLRLPYAFLKSRRVQTLLLLLLLLLLGSFSFSSAPHEFVVLSSVYMSEDIAT